MHRNHKTGTAKKRHKVTNVESHDWCGKTNGQTTGSVATHFSCGGIFNDSPIKP